MGQLDLQESDAVPLLEAASLAYFELAKAKWPGASEDHLRDVIDLAVVALAHVAAVYRTNNADAWPASVMSALEVEEHLFVPIREGRQAADLDRFYMRRSDLYAAIISLRDARAASPALVISNAGGLA